MKRKSFMRRLVISYLVIAVLPLMIMMSYYYANTVSAAQNSARQRLVSAAELAGAQFDFLVSNMSFLSMNLISNENFITAVEWLDKEESGWQQQEYYAEISSEICTYAILSSVHDVTFFNDAGYLITSHDYNREYNFTYRMDRTEMEQISWYDDVQDNFGREILIPLQKNQIPRSETQSITLVRAIRNPGEIIGYLCIEVSEENLGHLLQVDEALETEMLIAGEDGVVLYGSEGFPGRADRLNTAELQAAEDAYFIEKEICSNGITVYMALEKDIAFAETRSTLSMLALEVLALLALTILVIWIFSKDLAKPLVALQKEMKETTIRNLQDQGNEKLFHRYEEISYLYQQFHAMRDRLNVMIKTEMENQKMYMEERMNYLQAQINPHFMCNTLNVIGIMGLEHGAQKVQDACIQLSSLLQYSISDKYDGNSTLGAEMQNIKDYLNLMQLRYEHKLIYSVSYTPDMERIELPRLVLEPFVENIFGHAYNPAHKTVHVAVTGSIRDGRWYIVIEDDGQGMSRLQLEELKTKIDTRCSQPLGKRTDRKYGIGIENTIMRLYLHNSSFRYQLESSEDAGMRIELSAEYHKGEEYETDESDYRGR